LTHAGLREGAASPAALPMESASSEDASAASRGTPGQGGSAGQAQGARLTAEEIETLASLEKVDDYPLYTMRTMGAYPTAEAAGAVVRSAEATPWACSLVAALGDSDRMLTGRNFDWSFSPALLLFADPPDGYASVSMVDLAYLVDPSVALDLAELPLEARRPLLLAPYLPFDGMNDAGLAIGMAAVPASPLPYDPTKESIGTIEAIREILDHAGSVDAACDILESHNVVVEGGPALH